MVVAVWLVVLMIQSACGSSEPPDPVVKHVSMQLTDSSPAFGLNLLDRLLAEPGVDNVFVSPLSATLMLSMAASAAEGQDRGAMLTTLGLDPNVDPSAQARRTIERLVQTDPDTQLELAQAVWTQQGQRMDPAYAARLRSDYHAEVANLDFTSSDAPSVVNRWVDTATHHKITGLVDSFDSSVVAFLVNATYFHALWRIQFDTHGVGGFHTFTGSTAQVPMMQRTGNVTVLTTPEYSAAQLPYKGGRFGALLLLPRSSLTPAAFADFLTLERWQQAIRYLHLATGPSLGGSCVPLDAAPAPDVGIDCEGTLVMPKFTLDYKKDLTKTLGAMGMPVPGAVMSGLCQCFLSDVVQKTYLQVDETGTTAVVASGGVGATSAPIPMVVDHPFAFAIIDNATDAPLFVGAIGDLP